MSQHALPFFESDKAATKYAIQASGKSFKEVGHALWPDKSVERAQTDLLNALNDQRPAEGLTTDEHAFIANLVGRFDWLFYIAHKCSHSRPEPVAPEDQRARLQREFIESVRHLDVIKRQLDQTETRLRSAA